jgi:hypothetical protein
MSGPRVHWLSAVPVHKVTVALALAAAVSLAPTVAVNWEPSTRMWPQI